MNTSRFSTAILLSVSLLGISAVADAATTRPAVKAAQTGGANYSTGKVIHLGTILVTRANAEGAKPARHQGTLYLGSITVTPTDADRARYAQRPAPTPAAVFLGSIEVKAKSRRLPVIGTLVAAADSTRTRSLLAAVGALVFARVGG